mmetsp:Transcript_65414/g.121989  ORF Transcript_65414/g.121989 Transcript_65414/m.121989 type:complete len:515 (-) Transcript_65414:63-1607(-)
MQHGEGRQLRGTGAPRQSPQSASAASSRAAGASRAKAPPLGAAAAAASSSSGAAKEGDGGFYGSVAAAAAQDPVRWFQRTARWLETSDDTDPVQFLTFCCDDFKARKVKAPLVLAWLIMQVLGLTFQIALFSEVSKHLYEFEEALNTYCGKEHWQNDVCLGPAWNLSYGGVLKFPATQGNGMSDFDYVIPADQSFNFATRSSPATFLVGVEPSVHASWRLNIAAAGHAPLWRSSWSEMSGIVPELHSTGKKYKVITNKFYHGYGEWTGSMTIKSTLTEECNVKVYVVDSRVEHLDEIHKQKQCSFEDSWQNFNERHSGTHHQVLSNAQVAILFFLFVSVLSTSLVLYRFYYYVEAGKLLNRIIVLKFMLQDFPQQMCIAVYLYGWYATNGLRCQMCLFHPMHCDDEFPLHWSNLMVCIFTLLSATANQLLLQAKAKDYDEEEECFLFFVRCALFSVSVLPFSTSLFFLSYSVLHLRSVFIYILAGIPTLLGWGTLLCTPTFAFCDDSDLQTLTY